jgi:copper chaperone CopZ
MPIPADPTASIHASPARITKAVKSEDPKARVEISLDERLVKVDSASPKDEIAQRIAEAGYTRTAVG